MDNTARTTEPVETERANTEPGTTEPSPSVEKDTNHADDRGNLEKRVQPNHTVRVLMHGEHGRRALSDRGGDAAVRAGADVSNGERTAAQESRT